MLISLTICPLCGFKQRHVTLLEDHEPSVYSVEVSSVDDLSIRIIRSDTASIKIPDLNVEINPGLVADATISNVEAILLDIRDRAEFLRDACETEEERHNAESFLKQIALALEGKKPFTLLMEDPRGNSKIICDDPTRINVQPLHLDT
jgi:zinc finger protein ZPR1